jgi:hypothetical protein
MIKRISLQVKYFLAAAKQGFFNYFIAAITGSGVKRG